MFVGVGIIVCFLSRFKIRAYTRVDNNDPASGLFSDSAYSDSIKTESKTLHIGIAIVFGSYSVLLFVYRQ